MNFATNTAECSSSSSTTDSLAKAESISDLRERQAIDLFQSLLDSTPDMNIHYAAFVSAETVLLPNSDENDVTRLKNMPIVKHSDVWKLPRFMNDDHESIYKHTVDYYLKVQLDFMIMALPEADPEYLEDKIKATDGNFIHSLIGQVVDQPNLVSRQSGSNPYSSGQIDGGRRLPVTSRLHQAERVRGVVQEILQH